MSWLKIISATAIIIFIFGIATIDCAVAGEKQKIKFHGASFNGKFEPIKVGDEEGHVLVIYTTKQIYIDELTDGKMHSTGVNFMDINTKTGRGFVQGYGTTIYKDGDKTFRTHKGQPEGKGHWKGTWEFVKGTGKYEGIKGGGTWDSYSLGHGQSYLEVEGESEIP